MIVERKFRRTGLSFDDRYVFIRELEDAAQAAKINRAELESNENGDGTWDVAGTLKASAAILDEFMARDYLGLPLT